MLDRIDIHPTHTLTGFQLRVGKAFPFGATAVPGGVNFSVFSRFATECILVLFEKFTYIIVNMCAKEDVFRVRLRVIDLDRLVTCLFNG